MKTIPDQFDVLLYHDITVITDDSETTFASGAMTKEVPRAPEYTRSIGALVINNGDEQHLVEMHEITYGIATGLPAYNPKRPMVVSKPTIAAAARGGRPVGDLLYPYQPIRDPMSNAFLGVKGLARVVPMPRKRPLFMENRWPEGLVELDLTDLASTCPYDTKLFDAYTPDVVSVHEPEVVIPKAAPSNAANVVYAEQLDELETERLSVPVYETRALGLENDWTSQEEQWRVCHIDTPQLAKNASPQHLILHDLVRDEGKYMLGGRSLARLAPSHFIEPLI